MVNRNGDTIIARSNTDPKSAGPKGHVTMSWWTEQPLRIAEVCNGLDFTQMTLEEEVNIILDYLIENGFVVQDHKSRAEDGEQTINAAVQ